MRPPLAAYTAPPATTTAAAVALENSRLCMYFSSKCKNPAFSKTPKHSPKHEPPLRWIPLTDESKLNRHEPHA